MALNRKLSNYYLGCLSQRCQKHSTDVELEEFFCWKRVVRSVRVVDESLAQFWFLFLDFLPKICIVPDVTTSKIISSLVIDALRMFRYLYHGINLNSITCYIYKLQEYSWQVSRCYLMKFKNDARSEKIILKLLMPFVKIISIL